MIKTGSKNNTSYIDITTSL